MTKEQFWRIIEDVNAVSQNHDQETVWTRIVENLSHYPLEDIMDWHLIYHEYKDAAYRDEMFAVSTALGSDYADEGLNNFRAWLISCGKEVFMNPLLWWIPQKRMGASITENMTMRPSMHITQRCSE